MKNSLALLGKTLSSLLLWNLFILRCGKLGKVALTIAAAIVYK